MEFNVSLDNKNSKGTDTIITFVPVDNTIMSCDSLLVRVPVEAGGYFVNDTYTVTITKFVPPVVEPEEPAV